MTIRPIDLPELRAEFREQVASPQFMKFLIGNAGIRADDEHELADSLQWLMDQAELFHVSATMTELVCTASKTLETFTPERTDLPSLSGLVLFDGPLPKPITFKDGCATPLRGIFWASSPNRSEFMIFPIGETHDARIAGQLTAYSYMLRTVFFGKNLLVKAPIDRRLGKDDLLSLLETVWLLMQQPLASTDEVEPDRAARKRLRRLGQEARPVRVIELRRPKSSGEPGNSDREFHHQWIVRGHWRQQWFPKREVHRPVWIAPHIKGPEGAPLLGGEKVYALKR